MKSTKDIRCCELVRDRGDRWPNYHQCKRKGVVTRKGKLYCKLHDPEAVKSREQERMVKLMSHVGRETLKLLAPAMLALLKESQTSMGGDWRTRRDKLIAKAEKGSSVALGLKRSGASGVSSEKDSI